MCNGNNLNFILFPIIKKTKYIYKIIYIKYFNFILFNYFEYYNIILL